jgi:hypothetical protein
VRLASEPSVLTAEFVLENGLPCLDLLEATPGILRGLMTELTEEDARWKPAPEMNGASLTSGCGFLLICELT